MLNSIQARPTQGVLALIETIAIKPLSKRSFFAKHLGKSRGSCQRVARVKQVWVHKVIEWFVKVSSVECQENAFALVSRGMILAGSHRRATTHLSTLNWRKIADIDMASLNDSQFCAIHAS
jgi:hypothetical protein